MKIPVQNFPKFSHCRASSKSSRGRSFSGRWRALASRGWSANHHYARIKTSGKELLPLPRKSLAWSNLLFGFGRTCPCPYSVTWPSVRITL